MTAPADQTFDTITGSLGDGSFMLNGITYFNSDTSQELSIASGVLSLGGASSGNTMVGFKTADGSEFALKAFDIYVTSGGSYYLLPFRDGVQLSDSSGLFIDGAGGYRAEIGTEFSDIDEFWIVAPDNGSISIDNLDFEAPVLTHLAPTLSGLGGDTAALTEGDAPVLIDVGTSAVASDTDTFVFDGGSISLDITTNKVATEDVLGIRTGSGVSLSGAVTVGTTVFVGATAIGTITSDGADGHALTISFNGNANAASISTLLQNITYSNTNEADPSGAARTITTTFSDGDPDSADAVATSQVTVQPVDDAPVVTLGTTATASLVEGMTAWFAPALTISDVDSPTLQKATITISNNYHDGDHLALGNPVDGLTYTEDSATHSITITGTASVADFQTALRDIHFTSGDDPGLLDRTVSIEVTDSEGTSTTVTRTIHVTPVDDAPTSITGTLSAVDEFAARGTVLGTLAGVDPDDTTLSYSLVDGDGDDDNAAFTIDQQTGVVTVSRGVLLDFEQHASFSIRVRAEDSSGASVESVFTGAVNDVGAEIVTGDNAGNIISGGASADRLSGAGGADYLIGGGGNDTLIGGAGGDALIGGSGDDIYVTDGHDTIVEAAGQGTDTVKSNVTITLGANLDRLILTGSGNIGGSGNSLANTVTGNAKNNILHGGGGNDVLNGGAGRDVLYGGSGIDQLYGDAGKDSFVFDSRPTSANRDVIHDFNHADDTIRLEDSIFKGLGSGALKSAYFHIGTAAHDANDHIIYNDATGALYYDSDGTGHQAQVLVATIQDHATLAHNDFVLI